MASSTAVGIVFSVSAAAILLNDIVKRAARRRSSAAGRSPASERIRMTITVFLLALVAAMLLGIPIAFALLASGVA